MTLSDLTSHDASQTPSVPVSEDQSKNYIVTEGLVSIETFVARSRRPIVILPSLGRSAADYDTVAHILVECGWRVVRLQPRGIGNSKGPMIDLTLHDFAADVAMAMDHLKTGPAIIVGHAWGSQPARMLAVDRPDLVRGLAMAAASTGKLPPDLNEKPYSCNRDAIDGSGNLGLSVAQRLAHLRHAFFAPGNDPHAWLEGWYGATRKAQSHARDCTPVDELLSSGEIVPILELEAEFDAVVVRNVLKPSLGDRVEVRDIQGIGHAMAVEQPKAMADAIATFAGRLVPSLG